MKTIQKSIRIPKKLAEEIDGLARKSRSDFSAVTVELLEEAVKISRCPGIVFAEGVRGRHAKIAGTGLYVWEVISIYQSVDSDLERLKHACERLTEQQLLAALGYHRLYPKEIEGQIAENEQWTRDRIGKEYPFLPEVRE